MRRRKPLPPVSLIRERLTYDPDAGTFHWRINVSPSARAGQPAGSRLPEGHLMIGVGGEMLMASWIAWALMTGAWPVKQVVHSDRDPANDRWDNLEKGWGAVRRR